jgi:uncharacterized protein (TIGR03437 family)
MISGHRAAIFLVLASLFNLFSVGPASGQSLTGTLPSYTSTSIVQAATQTPQALAPNTIATIYGTNLAYSTDAAPQVLAGGTLPTTIDGVSVVVDGYNCNLFFVSPTQINFLVPYQLVAGSTTLVVENQGLAGPVVPIQLNNTAPGMFVYQGFIIATHLNGTLVSSTAPAAAGEIIVIYAAGLGKTTPATVSGKLVTSAATIAAAAQMQVLLGGKPCPAGNVLYAGLAPGFAGLYQINLTVPPLTPPNPTIQIVIGAQTSPPGVQLALQ